VELREELAGKKAEAAHAAEALERQGAALDQAEARIAEATSALHAADVRGAQLAAKAAATARELAKEQRELGDTQQQLAAAQEQLEKAKHWNDIQVRLPQATALVTGTLVMRCMMVPPDSCC
jgi:chromosome segregation ATPase